MDDHFDQFFNKIAPRKFDTPSEENNPVGFLEPGAVYLDYRGASAFDGRGFGSAWDKLIKAGLYNADLDQLPPNAASDISPTNEVPWWKIYTNGSSLSAKVVPSSTPSGYALRVTTTPGEANHQLLLKQRVRINGGRSFQNCYALQVSFRNANDPESGQSIYAWHQYYQADGTTPSGSSDATRVPLTSYTAGAIYNYEHKIKSPPYDAWYLEIGIGMTLTGTTSGTTYIEISDIRLIEYPLDIVIPDNKGYSMASIYKNNKSLWIVNKSKAGPVGSDTKDCSIVLSGSSGNLYGYVQGFLLWDTVNSRYWFGLTPVGLDQAAVYGDLFVNGLLATKAKSGALSDSDFMDTTRDGAIGIDSTNHRLYFRENGSWSYINRTAGFEIPANETVCPACLEPIGIDDAVIGKVDRPLPDGALHGLWVHLRCADLPLNRSKTDELWADPGGREQPEREGPPQPPKHPKGPGR